MPSAVEHSQPTNTEIQHELNLVLESRRFRSAPTQSLFLRYVVHSALDNQDITEDTITAALFPDCLRRKEESANVRVTAANLRKRLHHYYTHEGSRNKIRISFTKPEHGTGLRLPPGSAYKPIFTYNPNAYKAYGVYDDTVHSVEPFVSAHQAAAFLSLKREYLIALARKGLIKSHTLKTGENRRIWLFRISELVSALT
jgi:hypothetical protein